MKNRFYLFSLLSLLMLGCQKEAKQEAMVPKVQVGPVKQDTIPIELKAVGHCTAYRSVEIKAQVEGRLVKRHFTEGGFVKEGDVLLTIDPSTYIAELEKAMATRAENLAKLKYAAEIVARYKNLLAEDFVSQLDYDGFVRDLAEYEATVMQNDADIRLAQINLDYCSITAPFSGIAGKKLVDEGNLITNDGSTMVVINQIDPIFIDFYLPENDFRAIMNYRKGNQPLNVDIKIPNEKKPFRARLILVDNTIDQNTGMVPLRAQLCNHESTFWPGQYVEASLILTYEDNALLIPSSSISIGSKGQYVYVVGNDNIVKYVPIQTFSVYDDHTHVKADLKKGDRVITRGQINVRPNAKCEIVTNEARK